MALGLTRTSCRRDHGAFRAAVASVPSLWSRGEGSGAPSPRPVGSQMVEFWLGDVTAPYVLRLNKQQSHPIPPHAVQERKDEHSRDNASERRSGSRRLRRSHRPPSEAGDARADHLAARRALSARKTQPTRGKSRRTSEQAASKPVERQISQPGRGKSWSWEAASHLPPPTSNLQQPPPQPLTPSLQPPTTSTPTTNFQPLLYLPPG
jgi:hypothetical protein